MFFMSNNFYYHLQINFDGIRSCEGQINSPAVPTSRPRCALYSFGVQLGTTHENVQKARHHQQYQQKTPVSMLASFYQYQLA